MNLNEVPPLPLTNINNLKTATLGELASEVITLRLYAAQLYQFTKHLKVLLNEMTGEAPARLADAEERIADLRNRVYTLERANDERNRSNPPS